MNDSTGTINRQMTAIQTTESALTLMDIAHEDNALFALLDIDQGEVTPESEALAAELVATMMKKADSVGAVLAKFGAVETVISEEIDRLSARKKSVANRAARLRQYVMMAMRTMQRDRIEGALYTLTVQNNPPRVEVSVPVESLPEAYVRVVPESREVNKAAISAALKAGATIEGCALITSQSLRVR